MRRRRERTCSEAERWMDGKKASRSGCARDPVLVLGPASQKAC